MLDKIYNIQTMEYQKYNNISLKKKTYMGSNKNKGYEYDADRLYSSQKDKEKQLKLEKESRYGWKANESYKYRR